ncbi:MAG: lysylphosphatidylglycerol synthase transmembrane domain-containing protein [Myxococcota bacterium]
MKNAIRLTIALAVSAGLLWFAFRNVEWPRMLEVVRSVDPVMVLAFFASQLLIQCFRILRWDILIRPFATVSKPALFRIGGLGQMLIVLLPLRLGEFARPYLLKKETGAPLSSGLGSVVIERAIDGLLVTLLFFVGTTALGDAYAVPPALQGAAYLALAIFAGATLVSAAALMTQGWVPDLIERIGRPISAGLTEKAVGMLRTFVDGLRALPNLSSVLGFFLWTVAYWVANALGMYALALGFGWELPLVAGFLLVSILVIGIMVPAGPGFIGPFQVSIVLGLGVFGIGETEAAAYAMVAFPLTLISVLVYGLPWLFIGKAGVAELVRESQAADASAA